MAATPASPVAPSAPVTPVASAPAEGVQYASRRAAREAAAAASAPPVPQAPRPAAASVPSVAAPFTTFAAPPASESRPAVEARAARPTAPRRHPVRKRLSVVGAMLFVPGLFASLTLPAYASTDYTAGAADATTAIGSQVLALDTEAIASSDDATGDARDGYQSTSAADLKRLYRDALRQQNLAAYLASGAKEMGDDYPWAAELTRGQGGGLSPLNYYYRECVDFVAWRLNRDAGSTSAPFKYVWSTLTPGGGSAVSWKRQWEKHGWPISTTPQAGWVAWFPGMNHVAYVSGVLDDGSVAIEEYNWGPNIYGQRVIQASDAIYLSPPPR
ncbi:CHAP domain-containing protein [Protaetiibacter intestinalis]|uniref:CHAP domain-containing protein n=1 Tax=Protaetiibacter intestinalis TaxID=2419774 RepID=UPI0013004507|nr:CHAP domain-containing protein [Protaetiibacter intestinalis]